MHAALQHQIAQKLKKHQSKSLFRERYIIEHRDNNLIYINHKKMIDFASYNYLGLAQDPRIKKAFIAGIDQYGFGSSSSALISGYCRSQSMLEEKFSEFIGAEKSIFFNSGYAANLGVVTALGQHHSTILSDRLCHASLLDGILLSRVKHKRYPHHDMTYLEKLLNEYQNSLIITESVFSMEGDIVPAKKIVELSKKYQANLMIDDAHGIGVLGKTGRGIVEYENVHFNNLACLVSPLGKAFGSIGAVVSGNKDLIESFIQFGRSYIYTTALPPAVAVAILEVLNIVQTEHWRREKLNHLIQYFILQAKEYHLKLVSEDMTPIKSIVIKNNDVALEIKNKLMQQGYFVSCIRPPTVPLNSARLRISINSLHMESEISSLLLLLAELNEQYAFA